MSPNADEPLAEAFRHHWSAVVAALLRVFDPSRLDLVEDVAQEAMLEATRTWAVRGIPDDPRAWLLRVARNRALDILRRRAMADGKREDVEHHARMLTEARHEHRDPVDLERDPFSGDEDDGLTLVFLCCHEALAPRARVALTLKNVCGFGVGEVAAAMLDKEATVAQRLSRAKATLQREGARFALPTDEAVFATRYGSVLEVLYLLFNEGYRAHRPGPDLVREDLVEDALRLTHLLTRHPSTDRPETHALLALQLFCGARLPARLGACVTGSAAQGRLPGQRPLADPERADHETADPETADPETADPETADPRTADAGTADAGTADHGHREALPLAHQDRSLWRRDWIQMGFKHLERAIAGDRETAWHLEAAIASVHAAAPTHEATDWNAILGHYDRLLALRCGDPVVRLNRAVAIARVHGPLAALGELDALDNHPRLEDYALLHATRGHMLWQAGNHDLAANALERARDLARTDPEKRLLDRRLARCRAGERADPL